MKILLLCAIVFSSLTVFAMGSTDKSAIEDQLQVLSDEGYECREEWPKDFYLSSAKAGEPFKVGLNCINADKKKKTYKISYEVTSGAGSRCPSKRAISMTEVKESKKVEEAEKEKEEDKE